MPTVSRHSPHYANLQRGTTQKANNSRTRNTQERACSSMDNPRKNAAIHEPPATKGFSDKFKSFVANEIKSVPEGGYTPSGIVLSGHGASKGLNDYVQIPRNTWFHEYCPEGATIDGQLANRIERGNRLHPEAYHHVTPPYGDVRNYVLSAENSALHIMTLGSKNELVRVNKDTSLKDIINDLYHSGKIGNEPTNIHWAACVYNSEHENSRYTYTTMGIQDSTGKKFYEYGKNNT